MGVFFFLSLFFKVMDSERRSSAVGYGNGDGVNYDSFLLLVVDGG